MIFAIAEAVASPAHGFDRGDIERLVKALSDLIDGYFDDIGGDELRLLPDGIKQLFFGYDSVPVAGKMGEHFKRLAFDLDFLAFVKKIPLSSTISAPRGLFSRVVQILQKRFLRHPA